MVLENLFKNTFKKERNRVIFYTELYLISIFKRIIDTKKEVLLNATFKYINWTYYSWVNFQNWNSFILFVSNLKKKI